jgi:D-lactate dehydrogenase
MKIAFFDADDITQDYLKDKKTDGANALLIKESMDNADINKVKDADIVSTFVHATRFDEKILSKYPNLKLFTTRSTGFDHIDLDYCKAKNIEVCNVPRYGEITVAEYAFGLLLSVARKISAAQAEFKAGRADTTKYMGFDLSGRTLGVIGTGAIGRHAAKIAQGFGMKVLGYDLYPAKDGALTYVSLQELYKNSDVITLHAPSTKENYHMLNEAAFSQMKQGVIIINTARGDLIDGEALYEALKSGKAAGAGLDVLEYEDFLTHDDLIRRPANMQGAYAVQTVINVKLLQLDNVVATPHIAFNSIDAVHRILDITLANIDGFLKGKVQNSVIKK